jgi:hypothetical protein
MTDDINNPAQDDPKILTIDDSTEDNPIVKEIEIQCCEEPELDEIIFLDLTEIEKTRQDMSVNEIVKSEQVSCYVCNNSIGGGTYLCPICGTFYCKKCINSLIDRGGQCWNCKEAV